MNGLVSDLVGKDLSVGTYRSGGFIAGRFYGSEW